MSPSTCGLAELDPSEMRAVCGGARIWRPLGFTQMGEPVYGWEGE